jgi:hypothetical protein
MWWCRFTARRPCNLTTSIPRTIRARASNIAPLIARMSVHMKKAAANFANNTNQSEIRFAPFAFIRGWLKFDTRHTDAVIKAYTQGDIFIRNRLCSPLRIQVQVIWPRDHPPLTLEIGKTLLGSGEHITHAYFLESGLASVVVTMADGNTVEAGLPEMKVWSDFLSLEKHGVPYDPKYVFD